MGSSSISFLFFFFHSTPKDIPRGLVPPCRSHSVTTVSHKVIIIRDDEGAPY